MGIRIHALVLSAAVMSVGAWAQGVGATQAEADLKTILGQIPGVRIQRSPANVLIDGAIDDLASYKRYRRVVDGMIQRSYPIVDLVEFSQAGVQRMADDMEVDIQNRGIRVRSE